MLSTCNSTHNVKSDILHTAVYPFLHNAPTIGMNEIICLATRPSLSTELCLIYLNMSRQDSMTHKLDCHKCVTFHSVCFTTSCNKWQQKSPNIRWPQEFKMKTSTVILGFYKTHWTSHMRINLWLQTLPKDISICAWIKPNVVQTLKLQSLKMMPVFCSFGFFFCLFWGFFWSVKSVITSYRMYFTLTIQISEVMEKVSQSIQDFTSSGYHVQLLIIESTLGCPLLKRNREYYCMSLTQVKTSLIHTSKHLHPTFTTQ